MPKVTTSKSTLWKAIRLHCLWCCGGPDFQGAFIEVRECTSDHCHLHPYRFGKNPTSNDSPDSITKGKKKLAIGGTARHRND